MKYVTSDVDANEKSIIIHALTGSVTNIPYRNYYAAGKMEFSAMENLVRKGLMERGETLPYGKYYHVTHKGASVVKLFLSDEAGYNCPKHLGGKKKAKWLRK